MMSISQFASDLRQQMYSAPGRNEELHLFSSFSRSFNEIIQQLEAVINTQNDPINIVLMGEVKAGKSTLINSILKRNISVVNVAEATALIHQFKYSTAPYGRVCYQNGQKQEGSVEEIQKFIEEEFNDADKCKSVKCVEFGLDVEILKQFTLVDTPGIGTVTKANEDLTKKYIKEADVVLWIFNSHYIGQSNIREEVEAIANMNKEIIGVLNRIDELDMSQEELIEAATQYIGYLEFYPVSGYKALESALKGEKESYGVLELMDTVTALVGDEKERAKERIVARQLQTLIYKDVTLHRQIVRLTAGILKKCEKQKAHIDEQHYYIADRIYREYIMWLKNDSFTKELNELYEVSSDEEALRAWQEKYLNEEWIKEYMTAQSQSLEQKLIKYWQIESQKIDEDFAREVDELVQETMLEAMEEERLNYMADMEEKETLTSDGKAIAVDIAESVGIGTVLAGVVTAIAPTATMVGFIQAAVVLVPTVAVSKLIMKRFNAADEGDSEIRYEDLEKQLLACQEQILEQALKENPFMAPSEEVANQLKKALDKKIGLGELDLLNTLEDEIRHYEMDMDIYREKIKQIRKALEVKVVTQEDIEINKMDFLSDLLG